MDASAFSQNTLEVLKRRYLLKDDARRVRETPQELFRRVAHAVALAEKKFAKGPGQARAEEYFFRSMHSLEFLPNSPTLMNAGTLLGQLSACFVIPIQDSIKGIFSALSSMAEIHKSGGGTGFNFSTLRPRGDLVSSTKGEASGPVSFMRIFDEATGVIVQGGRRRGANMGILRVDHPDIEEFIDAKTDKVSFSNFNISVAASDVFMRAARTGGVLRLINPRTNKQVRIISARALFERLSYAAWKTGDPGLIFIDEVNRHNPTPGIGRIEATNPCGELPLLDFESCNLASINLAKMVKGGRIDWEKLRDRIHWGVRFLDDVIEVNKFPLSRIRDITFANRKLGLGVMGFADMLITLGIPYDSKEAVRMGLRLMRFMRRESLRASAALAVERGVFPNFKKSVYAAERLRVRNATVNTVAPTGTISIIAGCSSGIEPIFGVSFVRNILSGARLFEVNPMFKEIAKKRRFYSQGLMEDISRRGSLRNIKGIPHDVKRIFVAAFDVSPDQHLLIQAAFQRYTDNSVSKTINLPAQSSLKSVEDIYLKAHALKCKGITIYRYGAKRAQALSFIQKTAMKVQPEYSGGCVVGTCPF